MSSVEVAKGGVSQGSILGSLWYTTQMQMINPLCFLQNITKVNRQKTKPIKFSSHPSCDQIFYGNSNHLKLFVQQHFQALKSIIDWTKEITLTVLQRKWVCSQSTTITFVHTRLTYGIIFQAKSLEAHKIFDLETRSDVSGVFFI